MRTVGGPVCQPGTSPDAPADQRRRWAPRMTRVGSERRAAGRDLPHPAPAAGAVLLISSEVAPGAAAPEMRRRASTQGPPRFSSTVGGPVGPGPRGQTSDSSSSLGSSAGSVVARAGSERATHGDRKRNRKDGPGTECHCQPQEGHHSRSMLVSEVPCLSLSRGPVANLCRHGPTARLTAPASPFPSDAIPLKTRVTGVSVDLTGPAGGPAFSLMSSATVSSAAGLATQNRPRLSSRGRFAVFTPPGASASNSPCRVVASSNYPRLRTPCVGFLCRSAHVGAGRNAALPQRRHVLAAPRRPSVVQPPVAASHPPRVLAAGGSRPPADPRPVGGSASSGRDRRTTASGGPASTGGPEAHRYPGAGNRAPPLGEHDSLMRGTHPPGRQPHGGVVEHPVRRSVA